MAAVIVTDPVLQPVPLQPAKVEPDAGVGVRVTMVPLVKVEEQVVPQVIPAGELVTVPLPVPASMTERLKLCTAVLTIPHASGLYGEMPTALNA